MLLYHATTVKKLSKYKKTGYIRSPVRGFTTPSAAMYWAMRVGRTVVLSFSADHPHKLPDHHNHFGEAWWNDGDVTEWSKVVTPQLTQKQFEAYRESGGE